MAWGAQLHGKLQRDRDAALHVAGAAPDDIAVPAGAGQVASHRDGVEVAGDDDPFLASKAGAGDQGIAIAGDLQVGRRPKHLFDLVAQLALVAADRLHVDDLLQQFG